MSENILGMELHEVKIIPVTSYPHGLRVVRVVGGWLYDTLGGGVCFVSDGINKG